MPPFDHKRTTVNPDEQRAFEGTVSSNQRFFRLMLLYCLPVLAETVLLPPMNAGGSERPSHVADSARNSVRGFGYPKLSDISFSSRRFRPENERDPQDTFAALPQFFPTRLDWVYDYGNQENIIGRAKALGLNFTGTINSILPDELGGFVRTLGRDRSVDGRLSVLGHLPTKPAIGDVWSDDFLRIATEHVREMVRRGADGIQVDDPGMNYAEAVYRDGGYGDASNSKFPAWLMRFSTEKERSNWRLDLRLPQFSYREWVVANGGEDSISPALKELHEKFLLEGLLRFYERVRNAAAEANGGEPVPFSCNTSSNVAWRDYSRWADFGMAETRMDNISPIKIWRWLCAPDPDIGKGQLLSPPRYDALKPPDMIVPVTRSCIATTYAMGGLMMVPWDVWQKNDGGPRYFGTAAEYADIYGFVRAIPELFDHYEPVFCRGGGIPTSTYGFKRSPIVLQGDHAGVVAAVRCIPESESAPVVIHVVDWNESEPFNLIVDQTQFFYGSPTVWEMLTPTEYDRRLHESANAALELGQLVKIQQLTPETHPDGKFRFRIPALNPWGIIRVSRK